MTTPEFFYEASEQGWSSKQSAQTELDPKACQCLSIFFDQLGPVSSREVSHPEKLPELLSAGLIVDRTQEVIRARALKATEPETALPDVPVFF